MDRLRYVFFVAILTIKGVTLNDPCSDQNHKSFPENKFGSRNEKCPSMVPPLCDYYLDENWYVLGNATMLNRCPNTGSCGVSYPMWLNGNVPTESEGEVNRTACIKINSNCCGMNVTIRMKNCLSFIAYYLPAASSCPMAYCFESDLPCDPPTTQAQTTMFSSTTDTIRTTTINDVSPTRAILSNTHANMSGTFNETIIVVVVLSTFIALSAAMLIGWLIGSGRLCKGNMQRQNRVDNKQIEKQLPAVEHPYTQLIKY